MSVEVTQEITQPTQENTQAIEADDTKKSGRSQRSEKQKAALAAARAKAMEVRKQKAELKKLEINCKSNNVIDPEPIDESHQEPIVNKPIVNNDANVQPPPLSPSIHVESSSRYVTHNQLDEALAVRREVLPMKKYRYIDGYYIKQ